MASSISLIRHAEKQLGDGPPHGVLLDGSPDPESLTPRGWQRAGALVGLFIPRADGSGGAILPTPTDLFASEVGPHSRSRRPLEPLQSRETISIPLELEQCRASELEIPDYHALCCQATRRSSG